MKLIARLRGWWGHLGLIFLLILMAIYSTMCLKPRASTADEYAPAGKDFNGIWEERVFPQFVSLPDLATCEQFISWSEDQQEIYMKDYFREKYEGGSIGFNRCLDRFADEASYYVTHECQLNKGAVDEIILETDRIFKILCYERGLRRENPWRTGRP